MDATERFASLAVQSRLLAPDAAQRLVAQSRAVGRPAWELSATVIGLDATLRLLGQVAASPPSHGYEELGELGRGGMGRVARVRDPSAGREVALKALLDAAEPAARARFLREARITAQLEHPNIVPVYEVRPDTFTMKLVRGRSMKQLIDDEAAVPTLVRAFLKVCDAVAYAHSRGVIHRDLKPANIMIGDFGEVLVMDWGLALARGHTELPLPSGTAAVEASADVTQVGTILGTPAYMPPEQADGRDAVTERSDVYALGATLYECLALEPPFSGGSAMNVLKKAMTEAPRPPSALAPGRASKDLEAIALKALAKDPEDRYPSVRALAEDVERFLGGHPVVARRAGPLTRAVKWAGRNAALAGSAALATMVVLVVGLIAAGLVARAAGESARLAREGEALAQVNARTASDLRAEAEARAKAEQERSTLAESQARAAQARATATGLYFEVADLVNRNSHPTSSGPS